MRRVLLAVLLTVVPAEAYYHYVHFNRNALGSPIQEKFDFNALGPSKTVTFFVNDQGPAVLAPGDSFGSILGEVKQALAAWDSISTSDLRVAFGGLETTGQTSNTPGGDVIFQDLPPGLLGLGMPTSSGTTIIRGTVILSNNTSRGPGPSYLENFFTTAVHEVGHALGLQHTWTGAAMSQDVIRNTSRARKLDADDVAAISVLYGHSGWQANYGSISGRVTYTNGSPVALASVVALSSNGPAVSALTNPDGTYRIDGIPAGSNYHLYVHPLPPDAIPADNSGLRLPVDQNGVPLPASGSAFGAVFYPGTTDSQAPSTNFQIDRGANLTGRDFSVRAQNSVSMYDIITYSYLEPTNRSAAYSPSSAAIGVTPAFVNSSQGAFLIVAKANSGDTPVPQSVTILGGFGAATGQYLQSFTPANQPQRALALYFGMPLGAGVGPRHMVFNIGTDMYVLPNGVNLVPKGAPTIASVAPNADGSFTVSGSGMAGDSLVFVDGLPAAVMPPGFSGSDASGSVTVMPPQGASGQTSNVAVFNSDGQNSTFLQAQNPQTYTYPASAAPQISVDRTALPAGATSLVNITGQNTNFVDGQVTLGFGTEDVSIQHLWVVSPTQLQANIAVAAGAVQGTSEISVISGFDVMTNSSPFQVQAANPALPVVLAVVNANSNQQTIYPGSTATLYGANLPSNVQVTLNDAPMVVAFANSTQINFVIPGSFAAGLATLKVIGGPASANPVLVPIVSPPPVIQSATNAAGVAYDTSHSAASGDVIDVYVTGLDPSLQSSLARVQVTVSGVSMPVLSISPAAGNQFQIQSILTQSFGGQQVPLAVVVDGSSSATAPITVR